MLSSYLVWLEQCRGIRWINFEQSIRTAGDMQLKKAGLRL